MTQLYNEKIKNRFLSTLNSPNSYKYTLRKVAKWEHEKGKDLYEFQFAELEEVLKGFEFDKITTIKSYCTNMSTYLNWCIKQGYISQKPLPRKVDLTRYLVSKEEFLSKEGFEKWQETLSEEEKVITELLFHGVGGYGRVKKEFFHLAKEHINEKGLSIHLFLSKHHIRTGASRHLSFEPRTIEMTKAYFQKEGTVIENLPRCFGKEKYKKDFIQRSGMLYYAHKEAHDGEVDKVIQSNVCSRFWFYEPQLKGFLTTENVKRVYAEREKEKGTQIPLKRVMVPLKKIASSNQKRVESSWSSYARDSALAMRLKLLYAHQCMVCCQTVQTPAGGFSHAHHIQSVNGENPGDDSWYNMIVLCPNCHAGFDSFYYVIHPQTKEVCCYDSSHVFHGKRLDFHPDHEVKESYLEYAWEQFQVLQTKHPQKI